MDTGFILYEYIGLERGNMNQAVLNAKQEMVSEISSKIKESQSTVVVEYRGLSVAEVTELRRALRAEDVDFKVYKNTMAQRAVDELGFAELKESLKGPNALVLKSGIVEGKEVDLDTLKELANLPNRDGMLSMLLSCLQSPVRSFACVVKAVADAKEANGGEVAVAPEATEEAAPEAAAAE